MKKNEIKVNGLYLAKVNGKIVTVRVDAIREVPKYRKSTYSGKSVYTDSAVYDVTNLSTGRKTIFRSAIKFRGIAEVKQKIEETEGEQGSDPTDDALIATNPSTEIASGVSDVPTATTPVPAVHDRVQVTIAGGDRRYTYLILGYEDEVKVGSLVSLPGLSAKGTVVALGSDYTGPAKGITGVVKQLPIKKGTTTPSTEPKKVEPEFNPRERVREHPRSAPLSRPAMQGVSALSDLIKSAAKESQSVAGNQPHLIIVARAGTGKTTTLVEGLRLLKTGKTELTPSPQQAAVWDAMIKGYAEGSPRSICFVAFNKSIATELQRRVPSGCDAMTMHSMGFRAVQNALGRLEPNSYVVQDHIAELLESDIRTLRRDRPIVLSATEELVGLCKMNLVGFDPEDPAYRVQERDLSRLASHYDIDLDRYREEIFDLVPRVLDRCREPKGRIDFNDMIWLPVVLGLPIKRYDLLLVDEAQDLNRCQQAVARKAGERLILCGDPRQAIYGFAGADSESIPRMEKELRETERGVSVLPLTVTRRCGKKIVEEARRIVPDFSAFESNPEGKVEEASYTHRRNSEGTREEIPYEKTYMPTVREGDFILCRSNAPLVTQCFKFIRKGRKANIQGRDIGAGLAKTVKKLSKDSTSFPVAALVGALSDWYATETAKENVKRNPSENKLTSIQDRYECLLCFTEGVADAGEVLRKIESVFTDEKDAPGIRLSSVHKAKGLESKRVFFLRGDGCCGCPEDKLSAWEREQEANLRYVAITRAIEELIFVY